MTDDARAYWTEQMEAAFAFMRRLLEYPVVERGEPLACLRRGAREAGVEIAFPSGKKLNRFGRSFHVRASLVDRLLVVAEALLRRGYVLGIEDAYRSPDRQAEGARSDYVLRRVVERVRWELDGRAITAERVFRRLAVWSATTPKFANHTSGSAIDVFLLRRDGSNVDLGAPYPEFSERTPMDSPFIPAEARRHRQVLCELFAAGGFLPYPYEFWHFSHGDADYEMLAGAGRPARFGPVHFSRGAAAPVPVADILRPFVTPDDVRDRLERIFPSLS